MNRKKTIIVALGFLLVCLIALGIYFELKPAKPTETIKYRYVTVEVYYQDQLVHKITAATAKQYLGDFLVDTGIVAESEKSFFSTVVGITADYNKDQAWWKITKNGVQCEYGAMQTEISDGDKYELTYTIGFEG